MFKGDASGHDDYSDKCSLLMTVAVVVVMVAVCGSVRWNLVVASSTHFDDADGCRSSGLQGASWPGVSVVG
jgi:hypothetical protein